MITRVRVRMRIEIKIELTEKGQKWFEIRMEMRIFRCAIASLTSSVCWSVGRSVGHARVENLEKNQKSLEMIQK